MKKLALLMPERLSKISREDIEAIYNLFLSQRNESLRQWMSRRTPEEIAYYDWIVNYTEAMMWKFKQLLNQYMKLPKKQ